MDFNKLKHRPSFPIETIAVALSFSPYSQSILAEAKHLSDILKASLIIIHIGERTSEKEQQVNDMMRHFKIDYDTSRVIWMEGNEVSTILELCELNLVDLLVLGALAKENVLNFYLGSVARKISRKAKCSVLLITNPNVTPIEYEKIVINQTNNPKTENTINTALYLATNLKVKDVYLVNESDVQTPLDFDASNQAETLTNEIKRMNLFVESLIEKKENEGLNIIHKTIKGKPGYSISEFAKNKKADLLVVNSPDVQLNVIDRIFTHDMEYILANLPCNLLIVNSKT